MALIGHYTAIQNRYFRRLQISPKMAILRDNKMSPKKANFGKSTNDAQKYLKGSLKAILKGKKFFTQKIQSDSGRLTKDHANRVLEYMLCLWLLQFFPGTP